ncbi:MAG TPA: DNA adenine methylase [Ktedonobacteraceae bacterium]|nr:DNA adenine methylase [Ktedonobacteraceae bacterium]
MQYKRLSSLVKWAGGKEQELKYILPLLPAFRRYYEPFVGGGAVFFSIDSREKFINDRSDELVQFYTMVAEQNQHFLSALDLLVNSWQRISQLADTHANELVAIYEAFAHAHTRREQMELRFLEFLHEHQTEFCAMVVPLCERNPENFLAELRRNLFNKTQRMKRLEQQKWPLPQKDILANIESALKSAFYMHLRYLYNSLEENLITAGTASAIFFFIRENAYASMFRYNGQGKFNVPYGGITYNRKDLARKTALLRSPDLLSHFQGTVIANLDFEAFLIRYPPQTDDFLFLDPPYDSDFSTYTRNEFTLRDQERLADYLLTRCPARFLLVIKNTPFIQSLYREKGLDIQSFEKKYLVSFQDRNNREVEHLIIKNYRSLHCQEF